MAVALWESKLGDGDSQALTEWPFATGLTILLVLGRLACHFFRGTHLTNIPLETRSFSSALGLSQRESSLMCAVQTTISENESMCSLSGMIRLDHLH